MGREGECGVELLTYLQMPWSQLLSALDVPFRAQVAKGAQLFPPAADGPLVDIDNLGDVAVGQFGRLQQVKQDILFVLVESPRVCLGHGHYYCC